MARKKKLPKHGAPEEKADTLVWTWQDRGWIAQIIENEDGGGWAVAMTREGDTEPVYIAPWTMGRNKIDPKPLDQNSFSTWVKSASEFLMRAQRQVRDKNRQSFTITTPEGEDIVVIFDVHQDEYEAEGVLSAQDVFGNELARVTVDPRYRLTYPLAEAWVADGFAPPPVAEEEGPPPAADDSEQAWAEEPAAAAEEEVEEAAYEVEYAEEYQEPAFEYDA